MRTSLNEIEEIENWLLKEKKNDQNELLVEAKMLMNPNFKEKVHFQSKSYDAIRQYGREKLYEEIKVIETELFTSSMYESFRNRIKSIFKL